MIVKHRPTVNMNWDEPRDRNRAVDFIQNSKSDYIYLLNPSEESIDMALAAGKKVIARLYDPFGESHPGSSFDNEFHRLHTAMETYQWFLRTPFAKYKNVEVYFIIGHNELSANSADDIEAGITWCVELSELMLSSGHKVAMGGWNVSKSIRMGWDDEKQCATAPDVDAGIWDKALKFAHDHHESVIFDIHVYTVGRAWGQLVDGFPFDKTTMGKPPDIKLKWGERLNGGFHAYWHTGRENVLYVRMKEKGWYLVRFGYGETIWDNMSDIKQAVAAMKDRFGIPLYMNDMRGILSLQRFYQYLSGLPESMYTNFRFGADAFEDIKWLDEELPPNVEYIAVYCWNDNKDWVAYNVANEIMLHFIQLMKDYAGRSFGEEEPPQEVPESGEENMTLIEATVKSTAPDGTLIRKLPTRGGEVVGTLVYNVISSGLVKDIIDHGGTYTGADDKSHDTWRYISINGLRGWVATEYVEVNTILTQPASEDNGDNSGDIPQTPDIESLVRQIVADIAPDIIRDMVREYLTEKLRKVDFDIPYYTDAQVNPLVADVLAAILRQSAVDTAKAINAMADALSPVQEKVAEP